MKAQNNNSVQDQDGNSSKPLLCAGLVILVQDWGRMHQKSFNVSEIYKGIDVSKYKKVQWIEPENEEHRLIIEKKCEERNYEIKYVQLFG